MESVATSGRSCLATGVTQGSSSCHREASSEPASRLPRARASLSETETLIYRGDSDRHHHGGHQCLSSGGQQQVKTSSPPSQHSSAEESLLASSTHDAHATWQSQKLGPPSPFSSTPELLRPQTPLSPEGPPSSFSTPSSEENGLSEELSQSSPASVDMSSPVATAAGDPCCRRRGAAEGRVPKPFRPLLDDHIREMSSYQADYWACAIPDSLPPSPDRGSPHWNPQKEYEDLLDYAYPLKPRYKLGKVAEPFLHDSGIGLDSFSVSLEGTSRSTSIYSRGGQARGSGENGHQRFVASAVRSSTPGPGKRVCSGAGSSYGPLPVAKSVSSRPSRGLAEDVPRETAGLGSPNHPAAGGRSWCSPGSPFPSHRGQVKSTSRFLPTTQVLPLRKEWEEDEEFLSLPPRLMELERLAQFISELSLTIKTPGQDHHHLPGGNKDRQPLSSTWTPLGEACGRDKRGNIEDYPGLWNPCSSGKPSWENTRWCSQIHRDPLRGLGLPTNLGDTLDGTCLIEPGMKEPLKRSQEGESLAQCVKTFCCQLEELIRWLYVVADVTEGWVPPSPDAKSLKASLRRCLEFRKDVANHRSLTESVLEKGETLLDCMASSSPALKDTLGLIAKQSAELESHVERQYESIRAAMGPGQGEDGQKDRGTQQTAAQWVLPPRGFVSRAREE